MRISDWSSDVCSSDLISGTRSLFRLLGLRREQIAQPGPEFRIVARLVLQYRHPAAAAVRMHEAGGDPPHLVRLARNELVSDPLARRARAAVVGLAPPNLRLGNLVGGVGRDAPHPPDVGTWAE